MSIGNYIILFGLAFIGGIAALLFKNAKTQYIHLILTFSGAYLFGISVLHLIPEVYAHNGHHITGIYVLLGFFIQLLLEQFSKGIEHGHIHPPDKPGSIYYISTMLGLCIHAFLEGLPLANPFELSDLREPLLYGIAFHKMPAAFALVSIILISSNNKVLAISLLTIFALMSPFSAFFADHFFVATLKPYLDIIFAIVIGSFLHISTTILFESSSKSHKFSFYKIGAILVGAGMALLTIH